MTKTHHIEHGGHLLSIRLDPVAVRYEVCVCHRFVNLANGERVEADEVGDPRSWLGDNAERLIAAWRKGVDEYLDSEPHEHDHRAVHTAPLHGDDQ